MILELKEKLKRFGKVEVCETKNNFLHIRITEGYIDNLRSMLSILDLVMEHVKLSETCVNHIKTKPGFFETKIPISTELKWSGNLKIPQIPKDCENPFEEMKKIFHRDIKNMLNHHLKQGVKRNEWLNSFRPIINPRLKNMSNKVSKTLKNLDYLNNVLTENGITWSK